MKKNVVQIPFRKELNKIEIVSELASCSTMQNKFFTLWKKATKEIHPFQRGDSYQSSTHSINVLKNIDCLSKVVNPILNLPEKYILCCAAVLHDIDKAIIDYDQKVRIDKKHGLVSAAFIQDKYEHFGLTLCEADAVAIVTRYHGKYSLKDIENECENEEINDPNEYKSLGKINYPKTACLFKLADMMDLTYKRISDLILTLNYDKIPSKLLARKCIKNKYIEDAEKRIRLTALTINNFREYQALTIMVDMLNKELVDTHTKIWLDEFSLPNKFYINIKLPISEKCKKLIKDRQEISDFDPDICLLTVNLIEQKKLIKILNENKESFEFSDNEKTQLMNKYPEVGYTINKLNMEGIRSLFKNSWGYSIDSFEIHRFYGSDGSIETTTEIKNIYKLPWLSASLTYDGTEYSSKADFDLDSCEITECPRLKDNKPQKKSANSIAFELPHFLGIEHVDKIKLKMKSIGSWCFKKDDFCVMYPKFNDYIEDYSFKCNMPVCSLSIRLEFPNNYSITPKCVAEYQGIKTECELYKEEKSDTNLFIMNSLHDEIVIDRNKSPKYTISWNVE